MSETIVGMLNTYRDLRDTASEMAFRTVYGPTWLESILYGEIKEDEEKARSLSPIERKLVDFAREQIRSAADQGGYVEGVIRIAMLMFEARGWIDERSLRMADQLLPHDERFAACSEEQIAATVRQQAYITWVDHDHAVATLPQLLTTPEDREAAARLFESIRMVSGELTPEEEQVAKQICDVLDLPYDVAA